jgi:hypothetical protein
MTHLHLRPTFENSGGIPLFPKRACLLCQEQFVGYVNALHGNKLKNFGVISD